MIKVENLSYSYHKTVPILNNLSLHVSPGSVYGFIGSNGAGKSTAIRCILGLLSPKSGTVQVLGLNQPTHRIAIIKRTGYLLEGPHFYSNLTCSENLKLLKHYYPIAGNRIEEVLKKVGLWEYKDRLYGKCSTGMKQRLGIAKSFLYRPELLILDEPLNGLDPEWIVETRMIIKDLNYNFGTTIFLSSHILSELEKVVTHIGMLKNGQLEFEGPIDQFVKKTKAKQLFMVFSSIEPIAAMIDTPGITLTGKDGNCLEFSVEDQANLNDFMSNLLATGANILDIKTSEIGLEETYMKTNRL
jgi:ABC-type multidrug transport system ATPase subunit